MMPFPPCSSFYLLRYLLLTFAQRRELWPSFVVCWYTINVCKMTIKSMQSWTLNLEQLSVVIDISTEILEPSSKQKHMSWNGDGVRRALWKATLCSAVIDASFFSISGWMFHTKLDLSNTLRPASIIILQQLDDTSNFRQPKRKSAHGYLSLDISSHCFRAAVIHPGWQWARGGSHVHVRTHESSHTHTP